MVDNSTKKIHLSKEDLNKSKLFSTLSSGSITSSNVKAKNEYKKVIDIKEATKSTKNIIHFDHIFDSIKHYGRYQFFMLCIIQYIMLNSVGNYIFMSFATLRPQCQSQNNQLVVNLIFY